MRGGAGLDWEALLATYVGLGSAPETFWALTLRELMAVFKGAAERQRREHAERMTVAWWTANWPWLKHPPTLAEVIGRQAGGRRLTGSDEIEAALRVALA